MRNNFNRSIKVWMSVFILTFAYEGARAQGPWTLDINCTYTGSRRFTGTVDGSPVDVTFFSKTYLIHSTTGYISGTLYGSGETPTYISASLITGFSADYAYGVITFYGTLCANVAYLCPGPGVKLSYSCTVSSGRLGYLWEVTDDIQNTSNFRSFPLDPGGSTVDITVARLTERSPLNTNGYLYARVTDLVVPGAVSPWVSFKMYSTPAVFTVSGGGKMCPANTGLSVALSGSEVGIKYQLKVNGVDTGAPLAGTGSGLTWTNQTTDGRYTVMAIHATTGCIQPMNESAVVFLMSGPQKGVVSGGGIYCPGGEPVDIALNGIENNVSYQLLRDGVATGASSAIIDGIFKWANQTIAGNYTVMATDQEGCSSMMNGTASVIIPNNSTPPVSYNLTGGGVYCMASDGAQITLSSSQVGVNYDLWAYYEGGNAYPAGRKLSGTGSALVWTGVASTATFGAKATHATAGCKSLMSGTVQVQASDVQADQSFLDTWTFQYKYDEQRRMIGKKVPGADWVYMVYDDRDRLVLTQDGEQRKGNKWTFTKYDELNRPIATGIKDTTAALTPAQMQGVVNDYYALAATTKPWRSYGERFVGATTANTIHGYTNYSYPQVTTSSTVNPDNYLSITYYDNYTFRNAWTGTYGYASDALSVTVSNGTSYTQPTVENQSVTGQVTGTKVKILDGGSTWLKSISYYDDKYRMVQVISDNIKGGTDRTSTLVDFVGKVLKTKTTHTIASGTSQNIVRSTDYDHGGRVLKTWHSINGLTPILLVQHEYNELSQIVDNKLYSADNGSTFKQSVDYRYNIRGWMTSVNDVNNPEANDLFSMNLNYNTPTANGGVAQYNGNISEMLWKGPDAKTNSYGYNYDPMNRLTEAKYYNAVDVTKNGRFNEKIGLYDLNGNIKSLNRTGKTGIDAIGIITYGQMDNITYAYQGNQLLNVTEIGTGVKTEGFIDGTNTGDDYAYDGNGNMIHDLNKGIGATLTDNANKIFYNHLNLPALVQKSANSYVQYIYDATGRKLQQVAVDNGGAAKTTDYAGEFIYENNALQFINHEEGRITMTGSQPEYQYHLKDHLGNVRVTFTTKEEQEQSTATVEAATLLAEQGKFLNVDKARRVRSPLFDHTYNNQPRPAEGAYAVRLSGTSSDGYTREKYGLAKSLSVMPGDKIQLEVYAKYVDLNSTSVDAAIRTLVTNIASNAAAPGTVVDGTGYASNSASNFSYGGYLDKSSQTEAGPKAYLNYLVFDRDFNFIQAKSGFKRVTTNARESTSNVGDIATAEGSAHEQLSAIIDITEPGFVYIYLSNEETTPVEVYFDDFKVVQIKSPVIQAEDYYPFGLAFNSYSRENSVPNKFKFQGQEHVDDLGLNWDSFKWRNHQPEIGRFFNIDPLADKYVYNSPYAFSENQVVAHRELEGLEKWDIKYSDGSTGAEFGPYSNQQAAEQVHDDKMIISPVEHPLVNSGLGSREAPVAGASTNHKGADIVRSDDRSQTSGTKVVADQNGKITEIKSKADGNGAGNRISIVSKDGKQHNFFHLKDGAGKGLTVGQNISRGTKIGNVGSTGNVSGPHLHYEIRKKPWGTALNPVTANPALGNGGGANKTIVPIKPSTFKFPGQI